MGIATDCSTATAEAPGTAAATRMDGGARNGYCSIERPLRLNSPIRTIRIEITIATMGRRMKKFAIAYFPLASLGPLADAGALSAGEAISLTFSTLALTCTPGFTF